MVPYLELKYFRLIVAIDEEGSLAKAAERLFLTQSALSHQLKEIELQLNTRVYNRVNKTLILTDAGKAMLKSAKIILAEVQGFTKEIENQLNGQSGTLRLGTECNTSFHWLPKIIKQYQEVFPSVEVRIETNGNKAPIDLLLQGKIDVAIVYRKKSDNSISYTKLFTDDVVALVPSKSHLAKKPFLTPRDFSSQTYITHSRHIEHSIFFEEVLKPAKIEPSNVLHIQLTETSLEMIKAGLGITVMSRWLVEPYLTSPDITAVKIGENGLERDWYMISLLNTSSDILTTFLEVIEKNLKIFAKLSLN